MITASDYNLAFRYFHAIYSFLYIFVENPTKPPLTVDDNDMFPISRFPLQNKSKPLFKIGQVLLSGTIRHSRKDEPEEFRNTPSVTRILKETMPVESKLRLQIWEEKMVAEMGRDGFEKMQQLTLKRGHRLHSTIGIYTIIWIFVMIPK